MLRELNVASKLGGRKTQKNMKKHNKQIRHKSSRAGRKQNSKD